MPAKEIKELRQSGQLEEALVMAMEELQATPDNIWAKRNISWVYYEYIKKCASESNFEGFLEHLKNLRDLNLPEQEVMIYDTTSWQIASMLFKINNDPVDFSKINEVFELIKDFHFTKPSEGYSLLYKGFHKTYKNWNNYLKFADWWGFENFTDEDYQETTYNGRKMMALADQAFIAYSKKLLEGEIMDSFNSVTQINKEKIKDFLPSLENVIDKYPEYQYPPYFKAKLLLALGDEENVLSAFLPFAKQKRNDFWVWELLAEIFAGDENLQFACYCKALSLRTPEDFLVKTRQKFAELLINKQLFIEAKTEIIKIITIREQHSWKISNQLSEWIQSDWYAKTEAKPDNKQLYAKFVDVADEVLFQDIPEKIIIVEFVNKDKKILNFINSKKLHGYFSYKNLSIKPIIGDVFNVRLEAVGNEGLYKALTLKKTDESMLQNSDAYKEVTGILRIPEAKNFGFLEDVFISPDVLSSTQIKDGEKIHCKAIMSYNKKKNEWGWKCLKVSKENE